MVKSKQFRLALTNTSCRRYSTSSTVKGRYISNNNKNECLINSTGLPTSDSLNPILGLLQVSQCIHAEGSFSCIIKRNTASYNLNKTSLNLSSLLFTLCYRPMWGILPLSLCTFGASSPPRGLRITVRNYSATNSSVATLQPVKIYNNMDLDKFHAIEDNRGKSGIYRMTNLTSNKIYIGSSIDLGRRFTSYYNINRIERLKTSLISKALIKYGYSGFKLEILEYCAPEKCIEREQYYFDILSPEYNILKTAGSRLGFKNSEETLMKFRERKHSEETKAKISLGQIGRKHSEETKAKFLDRIRSDRSGNPKVKIEIFDQDTGIKTIYPSISEGARALGLDTGSISRYFSRGTIKPFKGRYYLKKI